MRDETRVREALVRVFVVRTHGAVGSLADVLGVSLDKAESWEETAAAIADAIIAAARAQGAAEEREKSRAAALAVSETHPNIGPALTVEQWRAFLRLPRPVIRILPHPDVQDYEIHDAARHEVAAVALYGQPFGFTHDDIQHLHWAANLQDRLGVRDAGWTANNLRSLADRIAALLPPTDEAPMPNPTPDGAA